MSKWGTNFQYGKTLRDNKINKFFTYISTYISNNWKESYTHHAYISFFLLDSFKSSTQASSFSLKESQPTFFFLENILSLL